MSPPSATVVQTCFPGVSLASGQAPYAGPWFPVAGETVVSAWISVPAPGLTSACEFVIEVSPDAGATSTARPARASGLAPASVYVFTDAVGVADGTHYRATFRGQVGAPVSVVATARAALAP